jgi:HEAT repeat protein
LPATSAGLPAAAGDPSGFVREAAVLGLARARGADALPALLEATRAAAAAGLSGSADPRARARLKDLESDPSQLVREAARAK